MPRLALLLVFASLTASAQTRSDLLYINPSALVSSTRLSAMAGASVGIADSIESIPNNYAAVAQPGPFLKRRWDWDFTFSVLFAPAPDWRDYDNDPRPGASSAQPVEGQLGLLYQYRRFGIGVIARTSARHLCLDSGCTQSLGTQELVGGIVGGFSAMQEQLVFGMGINFASAQLSFGSQAVNYNSGSVGGGALWRPINRPFRIGLSAVSTTEGSPDNSAPLANRPVYRGIITPTRVSLGASYRFGPQAELYNEPTPTLRVPQPNDEELEAIQDFDGTPRGPILVTAELDLIAPVKGATTLRPFLYGEQPDPAGSDWYLLPRLGGEWEVIDYRLRLRAGSWLEPNFVGHGGPRLHGTTGFEVRLFKYFWDFSFSGSVDVADRYLTVGASIGFWH